MKKIYFIVLISFFCLVGCQQEIFEQTVIDADYSVELRNSTIPTNVIPSGEANNLPDPIRQLSGIPVWVYLPEGAAALDKRYLSAYPAANGIGNVALSSDPDHIRTKWVFDYELSRTIYYFRFKSLYSGNDAGYITHQNNIPSFERDASWARIRLDNSPSFSNRHIMFFNLRTQINTLSGVGFNSNEVRLRDRQEAGYFSHWVISPVETFDMIDMKYDFLPNSNSFTATPRSIRVIRINNDSDIPSNETISVAETVTSQSTFSTTNNVSTSIALNSNVEIKIPVIATGGINTTVTHNSGWSFTNGGTQTKSEVFTLSRTLQIPPRTRLVVELVAISYDMNITYIATLKGRTTGKIIRLTGTWESVLVQEDDINIYHPDGRAYTNSEVQRLNIREI
ncbi:MAG: hypothetical protein LBI15_04200 [Dysgonamonadaceae bacterium]|jgi:hypothetical protein|nr:hypothetical protein [Dysgonamonadaceae bacterium]